MGQSGCFAWPEYFVGRRVTGVSTRSVARLAFVGFGEAARAFLGGWRAIGLTVDAVAFDLKTLDTDPGVADAKKAEMAELGALVAADLVEVVTGADVIISLVTADQANAVAEGVAAAIRAETVRAGAIGTGMASTSPLFLDGNSCAPGTKRRSALAIDGAGGLYVDMAVMAPVHPKLHRTPVLFSGPNTTAALELAQALSMDGREAAGDVGTASSIKMIRSVMMKGMEALFLECVLAGRRAGVDDVVLDSLEVTYPGFGFKVRAAYMQERVMTHGVRRAAEMREVARTVDDLGLVGDMARAAVEWQQRVGDLGLDANAIGAEDYRALADAILARLDPA